MFLNFPDGTVIPMSSISHWDVEDDITILHIKGNKSAIRVRGLKSDRLKDKYKEMLAFNSESQKVAESIEKTIKGYLDTLEKDKEVIVQTSHMLADMAITANKLQEELSLAGQRVGASVEYSNRVFKNHAERVEEEYKSAGLEKVTDLVSSLEYAATKLENSVDHIKQVIDME